MIAIPGSARQSKSLRQAAARRDSVRGSGIRTAAIAASPMHILTRLDLRLGVAYQLRLRRLSAPDGVWCMARLQSVNYQLGGALGTGFNTLTFSNPTFGEPAFAFQNGLQYNSADLYVASLDPGIRPIVRPNQCSPDVRRF